MATDPILPNLVFTKSTGIAGVNDESFNDAIKCKQFQLHSVLCTSSSDNNVSFLDGKFPGFLKLKGIQSIAVYPSGEEEDSDAYIIGLKIKYDGIDDDVNHGVVNGPHFDPVLEIGPSKITNHDLRLSSRFEFP